MILNVYFYICIMDEKHFPWNRYTDNIEIVFNAHTAIIKVDFYICRHQFNK